jgi:hypothetical protein
MTDSDLTGQQAGGSFLIGQSSVDLLECKGQVHAHQLLTRLLFVDGGTGNVVGFIHSHWLTTNLGVLPITDANAFKEDQGSSATTMHMHWRFKPFSRQAV